VWAQQQTTTDIGTLDQETGERAFPRPGYSPYAGRNYPTRVFWTSRLWVYLRSRPFSYCNGRAAKPSPSRWPLASPRQSRLCSEPPVALLGDVTEIPSGLLSPVLPDFGAIPQLLLPALSLTIVGLAVAAGVS
jgi:hypothetical protein